MIKEFKDMFIEEALKIVKKRADKEQEKAKYDMSKTEPKDQEQDNVVGKVKGYSIIQTHHISHTRDYEKRARNHGMDKKDYIRVIELFLKKRIPKDGKTYHLFYKEKGRYNNLVVKVQGNDIIIITVMQMQKRDVKDYFSKSTDIRLTLESEEIEFLFLGDLEDLQENNEGE